MFDRLGKRWRVLLAGMAGIGAVAYAGSGLTVIGPDQIGLVRRLGRFEGAIGPGLHLRWPRPIERVDLLEPDRVRSVSVGFRPVGAGVDLGGFRWESGHDRLDAIAAEEALVMTGDGRLVELMATVQYRIGGSLDDVTTYAFRVGGAEQSLRSLAESSLRAVVGRRPLDDLLTGARGEIERDATASLQTRAAALGLGVEVVGLSFRDAHPPLIVVDAYRDVSRAGRDAEARVNEARTYRAERLAEARGIAAETLAAGQADRRAAIANASGRADAFLAMQSARSSAPATTDHRLFAGAVETAIANRPKLILDRARSDRRRHLILADPSVGLPPWRLPGEFEAAKDE
jgi:Cu+-exporting ATPase